MSPRILYAILACSFASLVVNVALLYVIVSRSPRAVASPATAAAATGGSPSAHRGDEPASAARAEPFQRDWEYVDKASGRRLGVVLLDDTERLERFVRTARLSPAQEVALRQRYAARRAQEMGLARDMVRAGEWHSEAFRRLQTRFWGEEFRALPHEQSALLPPEFLPPG